MKPTPLLMNLIFNPKEVHLPAEYEEELIGLNVWPKHVVLRVQKERLLSLPSFKLNDKCTVFTRAKELRFVSRDE